jgi:hypothetical protein
MMMFDFAMYNDTLTVCPKFLHFFPVFFLDFVETPERSYCPKKVKEINVFLSKSLNCTFSFIWLHQFLSPENTGKQTKARQKEEKNKLENSGGEEP